MHEHMQQHTSQIQGSSDRSFGLVFAAFFLIVALLPLLGAQGVRYWALGVSVVFALLALAVPLALAPANRIWTKFGLLLHKIVSPIALGILFFAVVAPTGFIMRLLGKDLLRLRFDASANSYWIARTPPGPDAASLKNQF
jgi:hypothetical protein